MRFGVRSFLLVVAAVLFIVAAAVDDPTDWLSIGLAVLAAAFVFEDVEMPGRK